MTQENAELAGPAEVRNTVSGGRRLRALSADSLEAHANVFMVLLLSQFDDAKHGYFPCWYGTVRSATPCLGPFTYCTV